MNLYRANVVKMNKVRKTDFGYSYEIDGKDYYSIYGVVKDNNMIDIENGIKYHIIKRDELGQICREEKDNIFEGEYYIYSHMKIENDFKAYKLFLLYNLKEMLKHTNLIENSKQNIKKR